MTEAEEMWKALQRRAAESTMRGIFAESDDLVDDEDLREGVINPNASGGKGKGGQQGMMPPMMMGGAGGAGATGAGAAGASGAMGAGMGAAAGQAGAAGAMGAGSMSALGAAGAMRGGGAGAGGLAAGGGVGAGGLGLGSGSGLGGVQAAGGSDGSIPGGWKLGDPILPGDPRHPGGDVGAIMPGDPIYSNLVPGYIPRVGIRPGVDGPDLGEGFGSGPRGGGDVPSPSFSGPHGGGIKAPSSGDSPDRLDGGSGNLDGGGVNRLGGIPHKGGINHTGGVGDPTSMGGAGALRGVGGAGGGSGIGAGGISGGTGGISGGTGGGSGGTGGGSGSDEGGGGDFTVDSSKLRDFAKAWDETSEQVSVQIPQMVRPENFGFAGPALREARALAEKTNKWSDEASREFSGIAQRLRSTATDYDEREQINASISGQMGVAQ
ncbi:WXG100 family type VII secretion target [uncultured Tessaracoccus sp.]|uniref:WXG100 family type VII secretion target n=1 Tax=uncultured Tessaracoccus sp. TaxID=905023 RepID=UPI002623F17E|nr:hypothetical protein [uncultured Tessaracoccus sp.]